MTPPVLPGGRLFGRPQCGYCGQEEGDPGANWRRLGHTSRGLIHDGCLGDIETDNAEDDTDG